MFAKLNTSNQLHDTFIQSLFSIIQELDTSIDNPYLYGRTGHGARFSLGMNTRTGKEIGHPISHYCWDIVGVVSHCFPDTGITATLYIGPGYATRARSTAAQSDRELADQIVLLDSYDTFDHEVEGYLMYPDVEGVWHTASSNAEIDVNWGDYPFGPVVLQIHGISKQSGFPASTFRYLVDTLERGEEPMEIRGKGDYSTVSGWKAFARWMQSYSVPLPEVQHPHLEVFPDLLIERRSAFVTFLKNLQDKVSKQEKRLIDGLLDRYEKVVATFDEHLTGDITLSNVRTAYFAEQKTLTFYKKIDTYLEHHYDWPD